MDTQKNIELHDSDIDVLNAFSADYAQAKQKAELYAAQAETAKGYRQLFIRGLIQKAGAPGDVQYSLSPDGRLLVPVRPPQGTMQPHLGPIGS